MSPSSPLADTPPDRGRARDIPAAGAGPAVERLVEGARELLEMDAAWLGEVSGSEVIFCAVTGDPTLLGVRPGDRMPLGQSFCGFLLDGRIGSVVADVRTHPELGGLRLVRASGVGAYVGVPVELRDGRRFGTLCCAGRRAPRRAGAAELRTLKVLAGLIAGHLEDPPGEPSRAGAPPELEGVRALMTALEHRSGRDPGQGTRAAATAVAVAEALGLQRATVDDVEQVALLADLGKVGVPEAILAKAGTLTARERERVRELPLIGERIVAGVAGLAHLAASVRAVHERWDGAGHPDGLRGTAIPLPSRIASACAAWHAMRSPRPHRPAQSAWTARTELQRGAGAQFDPAVVAALLDVLDAAR